MIRTTKFGVPYARGESQKKQMDTFNLKLKNLFGNDDEVNKFTVLLFNPGGNIVKNLELNPSMIFLVDNINRLGINNFFTNKASFKYKGKTLSADNVSTFYTVDDRVNPDALVKTKASILRYISYLEKIGYIPNW
jgi:hypothetical protein